MECGGLTGGSCGFERVSLGGLLTSNPMRCLPLAPQKVSTNRSTGHTGAQFRACTVGEVAGAGRSIAVAGKEERTWHPL